MGNSKQASITLIHLAGDTELCWGGPVGTHPLQASQLSRCHRGLIRTAIQVSVLKIIKEYGGIENRHIDVKRSIDCIA